MNKQEAELDRAFHDALESINPAMAETARNILTGGGDSGDVITAIAKQLYKEHTNIGQVPNLMASLAAWLRVETKK